MCQYAIQKNKFDKITCAKQDGDLCGHVYYCQLSCSWKLNRSSETCTLATTAEAPKVAKRRKAVKR